MKTKAISGFLLVSLILSGSVFAQRKKTSKTPQSSSSSSYGGGSSYGNSSSGGSSSYGGSSYGGSSYGGSDTSRQNQSGGQSSAYGSNNQTQSSNQPQSNIPIVVIPAKGNGFMDSVLPTKRKEAIERNLVKERKPLMFENIREDDAVYRQRIWREIDTREKMNSAFRSAWDEDNGNQRFISIIMKAIMDGKVMAFDPVDDRFTTFLTAKKVMELFSGGVDTVPVYDMQGNIERYEVRAREFDPDSIYQFRIKEEWIFDKESSRMFVRILGICPVKPQYTSSGIFVGMIPLFWVYYPDELRPVLAEYEAFNSKNFGARMTWEELFENRMFSSYLTKSTLDNPYDRRIRDYIKDPIMRLLEGDRIMEKIFNYEQDLWSY
jgi:gliding motility associated protien GldN